MSLTFTRRVVAFFVTALFSVAAYAVIDPALQMQTGNPTNATADANNHAHYLIQRPQYALDYNDTTHEPNWVAWDYTTADSGGAGRSPNFFQDTTLPAGFYQVLTTDYSGSGYDRGHMSPSADRTVTRADNDATFYMSNMVPQSPDNNQGVWANFESYTRSLAAAGNEILIISGPSLFGGSTIASGVAIPGYTWKIALIVPTGPGTALDRITASTRIITIKIPNIAGVRNTPWENFVTSVAQIESDTGFTFLTALNPALRATLRTVVDGQVSTGAPSIAAQPTAQTAPVGATAAFTVTATGDAPLSYQWLKNDDEIPGATASTLTLTNVQASDVATYTVTVSNNVGSVTSNGADLIVSGLPPTIAEQPTSRTAAAGSNVSFTVTAGGSAPFNYQWRKGGANLSNGGNVSGASTPTLTLANVQSTDVDGYDVVVTNNVSNVTSSVATLTVSAAAPTITSQPANRSLAPGSVATFTVVATGSAPLTYQWRKGGVAISTATNASAGTATLTLTGITSGDGGNYDVLVTNGIGSAASSVASLTITSASATQIFYTGGNYVQDFNTLPSSGTYANNFAGSATAIVPLASLPTNPATGAGGWSFTQTAPAGTERFTVGTGSSTTGSTYSFGSTSSAERALGILSSGTALNQFGAVFVNNTGQTLTTVTLSYVGEQWRWNGATGDKLSVEYQLGGTDIVAGTFTAIPALDFVSPIQSGTAGALDGNAAANRRAISTVLGSIAWAPGQTLVLRWKQVRTTSADGLAVDDFSLSTAITGAVGPSVASTVPASAATNVALNAPIAVTFDQAVNVSGSWFTINSATRGALSASVTASADLKTYTLTLPSNYDFSESISVSVFAAGVTSQSTGLHPAANYSFSFVTAAPVAPSITTQPTAQTVSAGSAASFTVAASGTAPFSYQWRKGGVAIAGNPTATAATLVLANAQSTDVGSYDVVIGNGVGSPVTSNAVSLTVTPVAPTITTQPVAQNVAAGGTVTLSVVASGSTPFTYQWRKGGVALSDSGTVAGSSTSSLTLSGVTVLNSGSYDVVVSNGVGSPVTSTAVTVLVIVPPSLLNYAGGTYAQNFDTLPSTGTFTFVGTGPFSLDANPGVNATGLAGWSFAKYSGSGANALFKFDNGGSNSGSAVSYGTTSATDRALGSVASGTTVSRVGVTLVNTTGQTINYVTVSYTGEQWRRGSAAANKFTFEYGVGNTDINTGTFTAATALDFTAPVTTGTDLALDGNLPANRTAISATITGLTWAPGQTLVLRWSDVNDGGNDDAIAIDDFSLTNAPPVPTITTQPIAQTVPAFSPASFTVAATSTTPVTYQWRKDGAAIVGNASATTATLTLANATAADVGAYDCVVTNSFGFSTSNTAALTVTKVTAGIALDTVTATYDGTPKFATALTTPAGLTVAFTYNGSATAPTNAGTYAVVATIVDANYTGTTTGSFTIAPAVATVTLGGLNSIYNAAPQSATATTVPEGLAVAFTYDGGATPPTNAGAYAVVATVADPNYTGSATGTLTIAKAGAGVILSGLSQTYNTATHAATVATTPAGLAVAVTYDGGSTLPTNAGSYAVAATVNDANYFGSATGTLVVGKAPATVALAGLAATYDGTPRIVTATTTPAGLTLGLTYDGSATAPTNAGSYTVTALVNDANYLGSATGTLVVAKAAATIALTNTAQTYDGTAKSVTVSTTPTGLLTTLTYDGSATAPTNAGTYTLVAAITDQNYAAATTGTLTIAQATQTITFNPVPGVTYGDAPFAVSATADSGLAVSFSIVSGPATISGNTVTITGAGPVIVRASQTGNLNYSAAPDVDQSFTVGKANQAIAFNPIAGVTFGDVPFTVSATSNSNLAVTFSIVSGPATISGSTVTITGAGPVVVRAAQTGDSNYNPAPNVDQTFTVGKANQAITFAALADKTYGNAPFALSATSSSGLPVTFSVASGPATIAGNTLTLTGAGPVIVRAAQAGDANTNAAPNVDRTFTVAKATLTVTAQNAARLFGAANPALTIAYSGFVGSDTAAVLDTAPTATTTATAASDAGTYPITAAGGVDDSYAFTYVAGTLAISTAAQTITFGPLASRTFGEAPFGVSATSSAGLPVTFSVLSGPATVAGSTVTLTGAGAVTLRASQPGSVNYAAAAPVDQSFSVAKAAATITFTNLTQVYTGTPKSASATTVPAGLAVTFTYNGSATAPTAVGSYTVIATIADANYAGTATGIFSITKPVATVTLGNLSQVYDGTPKSATATTTPAGLSVTFTYDGSATAPSAPGSYAVVATITDPNYSGTASGTLVISTAVLVRHAPSLNGDIDGSVQVLLPESTTLNGGAMVSGDLLVPGTPTVQLNGHPAYGSTLDGTGAAAPSNYTITLNGNAVLRHVVRRTNAATMPVVNAPPSPTGTRSVSLNSASDSAGDFATLRNLTLNSNAGTRVLPAGTYGSITVNGNSTLILGVAGATTPAVYNLQSFTLNGSAAIQVVGPVVLNLASGVSANSSIGNSAHPEWLAINLAAGGFTLNGNVNVYGSVTAPNGTVTINGNSVVKGRVIADRLTLNGNGLLDTIP